MPTLYPYQAAGAEWLAERPRALLADDPGLGKTATVLAAADRVGAKRVLVIAPTCVLWNWKREVATWSPHRSVQVIDKGRTVPDAQADVVIVTHGLLLNKALRRALLCEDFDAVVLDESHFFRSPDAQRVRAFYGFGEVVAFANSIERVWLLSATPMPNNASELWTMARGAFGFGENFRAFRSRYCVTAWSPYGDNVKVVGNKDVEDLRERLRPFVLRRRKSEVLKDLPPVRFESVTLQCDTHPVDIALLEDALDPKLVAQLRDVDDPGEAFAELGSSKAFAAYRRLCGLAKAEAVSKLLETELVSGLANVVVMAHHKDVVEAIANNLRAYGVRTITGATSAAERESAVAAFQSGTVRAIVCNIVAGGTGITLTAASELVFAEMSYVPGENVQAADRIHRIGQKDSCRVRFVSLEGTLDESLVGVLVRKTQMIREVLDR